MESQLYQKAKELSKEQKKMKVGQRTAHFKTGSVSKGYTLGYAAPERLANDERGVASDQLSDIFRCDSIEICEDFFRFLVFYYLLLV